MGSGRKNYVLFLKQSAMVILSAVFAFPFVWLLSTSLKASEDIFRNPLSLFSGRLHWENYVSALTDIPFFQYAANTAYVTIMSIIGQLFGATLTAYSVSLIDWRGKKVLFGLILATMMIPIQVTMVHISYSTGLDWWEPSGL